MKKISIILLLVLLLFMGACTDDFASYEHNQYDISQSIKGNIYIISEIEPQIKEIASEYSKNAELKYVEYNFEDNNGTVLFSYEFNYSKGSIGYTELIDIYINMSTKTATRVEYINGHAKRVGGHGSDYINDKNTSAFEIYMNNIKKAQESKQISRMCITYCNNQILINGYDNEDRNTYHQEIIS